MDENYKEVYVVKSSFYKEEILNIICKLLTNKYEKEFTYDGDIILIKENNYRVMNFNVINDMITFYSTDKIDLYNYGEDITCLFREQECSSNIDILNTIYEFIDYVIRYRIENSNIQINLLELYNLYEKKKKVKSKTFTHPILNR